MKRLLAILFTSVLLASCEVRIPSDVISKGKMTNLLYDYHVAQQMASEMGGEMQEQRYVLVHKVFEKYGVTEAEFDSSMVWYSGNSKYLVEIYEDIETRMKREMKQLGVDDVVDEYANLSESGDTARIWNRTNLWLRNNVRENILSFNIKADSSFLLGDTYLLRFNSKFVCLDNRREAYAMLSARYENDSVAAQVSRISGNREATLRINESELTKTQALKQLTVTFYLNYEPDNPMCLWMISKPSLIRFHHYVKPKEEPAAADSVAVPDSLLAEAQDSLKQDTLPVEQQRVTPQDVRQEYKGEKNIHVVKKRNVIMPAQPVRRQR